MKNKIAELIVACDMQKQGILSGKNMSPSSSIEDIAAYLSFYFRKAENINNSNK